MSDTNIGTTEPTGDDSQAERTFTQSEVNAILARNKTQLEKRYSQRYEELGDPDTLKQIVSEHQTAKQEQQLKRGEFERVLQEKMSAKDTEISKRDRIIESFRVETPIVDAAARYRAVNPDQVRALIRGQVRLNAEGEVEVTDDRGAVRYDDAGRPVTVDAFVQSWLQSNPHFVSATPATTNTRSNTGPAGVAAVDLSKLDMRDPADRKIYAQHRKSLGIA